MFNVIKYWKELFEVLLVTTTYLSVRGVSGAWLELCGPLELTRGHWWVTLTGAPSSIAPVFTDFYFLSSCINAGQTSLFEIECYLFCSVKKKRILYLNKHLRRFHTLETNAKLKVEPKSLSTQDIYFSLLIYLGLGEMCFMMLVSFQAYSNSEKKWK